MFAALIRSENLMSEKRASTAPVVPEATAYAWRIEIHEASRLIDLEDR